MTAMIDEVGVGTLNVYGLGPARAPVRPFTERIDELGRRLDTSGLDLLNLQEVWFWPQLAGLRRRLPSFPHVVWRPGVAGPAGGLVTFSRRPLGRSRFHTFAGLVPTVGDARFRLHNAVEAANKGILVTAWGEVTVVNTHLPANYDDDFSPAGRFFGFQRAAVLRLNRVLAGRSPLILTGDLNIASTSELYPLIVDHGARLDHFAPTDEPTFHVARPSQRIDYALVSGGLEALGGKLLLAGPVDGSYLSDHIGLELRVGLPKGPARTGL